MSDFKITLPNGFAQYWKFNYFETVDSTNRIAADLARNGQSEGQIILADHQDSGRGRLDRSWVDSPGSSVLMSFVLRPKFPSEFFFLVTSALSLAASQVLNSRYSIHSYLKWPNDVMVSDRKIAGILAEVNFDERTEPWMVVGIGLNCRQRQDELAQLGRPATSIFLESAEDLDLEGRKLLASEIAANFGSKYLSLNEPKSRISIASEYRSVCETIGKQVRVEMMDEVLVGVAADISVEGNLLVETDSCIRAIASGDVVHLRKSR